MFNKIINIINNGKKKHSLIILSAILLLLLSFTAAYADSGEQEGEVAFEIIGFTVDGNTLLTENLMLNALTPFTGESKTAEDVEKARDALEKLYHNSGYPAVLVNIPRQTVEDGLVRLSVIESKIKNIKVTGNKFFTRESILKRFPSLKPGEVVFMPRLQQEFAFAGRNPDMKISPLLMPGKELGTIDVELKVKDSLPLHGSLELNNRSTHATTDLRLNGSLQYDNLWQKEHSFSLQYQISPEDTDEVKLLAESYVFSPPWNQDHIIAIYAVWSDSDTAFGDGIAVVGKGQIFGGRYIMSLPSVNNFSHNITFGMDYKDFDEDVNFSDNDNEGLKTPIKYLPLLLSYSAALSDERGKTQFSLGLNMSFRNLVTDQREFGIKRLYARGDYLYVTAGIERAHKLPYGIDLFAKLDGQVASQPLISNEQFIAGGVDSVRGYKESELSGDHGIHGGLEIVFPELTGLLDIKSGSIRGTPYLFFEMAELWTKSPPPGEEKYRGLRGAGAGIRGEIYEKFEYGFDGAVALKETDDVEKGYFNFYMKVKYKF